MITIKILKRSIKENTEKLDAKDIDDVMSMFGDIKDDEPSKESSYTDYKEEERQIRKDMNDFAQKSMYRDYKENKKFVSDKIEAIQKDLETLNRYRYLPDRVNSIAKNIIKPMNNFLHGARVFEYYYESIDVPDEYREYTPESDAKFKETIEEYREAINTFEESIKPLTEADDRDRVVLYIDEYIQDFKSEVIQIEMLHTQIYAILNMKLHMAGLEQLD